MTQPRRPGTAGLLLNVAAVLAAAVEVRGT